MMVIRHLSSEVDLERGVSQHSMVVGLLEGGAFEIPIDAMTYGQLVGAFEQLHLQAQMEPQTPTVEDVRQQVEQHLGHQLAPGPVPEEETSAAELLRELEQEHVGATSEAEALLKSVGFFENIQNDELDAMSVGSSTEDDEPDPGEDLFPEEEDDGIEAY